MRIIFQWMFLKWVSAGCYRDPWKLMEYYLLNEIIIFRSNSLVSLPGYSFELFVDNFSVFFLGSYLCLTVSEFFLDFSLFTHLSNSCDPYVVGVSYRNIGFYLIVKLYSSASHQYQLVKRTTLFSKRCLTRTASRLLMSCWRGNLIWVALSPFVIKRSFTQWYRFVHWVECKRLVFCFISLQIYFCRLQRSFPCFLMSSMRVSDVFMVGFTHYLAGLGLLLCKFHKISCQF